MKDLEPGGPPAHAAQVGNGDSGPLIADVESADAQHSADPRGPGGPDPGQGVLKHNAAPRLHPEGLRRGQVAQRVGLAADDVLAGDQNSRDRKARRGQARTR